MISSGKSSVGRCGLCVWGKMLHWGYSWYQSSAIMKLLFPQPWKITIGILGKRWGKKRRKTLCLCIHYPKQLKRILPFTFSPSQKWKWKWNENDFVKIEKENSSFKYCVRKTKEKVKYLSVSEEQKSVKFIYFFFFVFLRRKIVFHLFIEKFFQIIRNCEMVI